MSGACAFYTAAEGKRAQQGTRLSSKAMRSCGAAAVSARARCCREYSAAKGTRLSAVRDAAHGISATRLAAPRAAPPARPRAAAPRRAAAQRATPWQRTPDGVKKRSVSATPSSPCITQRLMRSLRGSARLGVGCVGRERAEPGRSGAQHVRRRPRRLCVEDHLPCARSRRVSAVVAACTALCRGAHATAEPQKGSEAQNLSAGAPGGPPARSRDTSAPAAAAAASWRCSQRGGDAIWRRCHVTIALFSTLPDLHQRCRSR
jgi:hypothetical protein